MHTEIALQEVRDVGVYDLGYPMVPGMPQSPRHPSYTHALVRRHGDQLRKDGSSSANDVIVTGTHVGTHVDAVGHYSDQGRIFGGISADEAQRGGRLSVGGVEEVPIFFTRGVLLDIPAVIGLDVCPADYEVTPADLQSAEARQRTPVAEGDVVLIGTGWGENFAKGTEAFLGWETGAPGVGEDGARWLAERQILAAGAETIAFERVTAEHGHSRLPAHRILLAQRGIYLFETMDLKALLSESVYEFLFVASPLKLVGATGAPVRPIAVVAP